MSPFARMVVRGSAFAIASCTALAFAAPGCTTTGCEGVDVTYGDAPGQGDMLDDEWWESSPLNAPWVAYSAEERIHFKIPQLNGRTPDGLAIAYISPACLPNSNNATSTDCTLEADADSTVDFPPQNWSTASGNLAEFQEARPNAIDLLNDTCANFFVRVLIHVSPSATPTSSDAGTD